MRLLNQLKFASFKLKATERKEEMKNNAIQNQIRLSQNIAGLAALRMFTDSLCSKTPLPTPPPPFLQVQTIKLVKGS